MAFSWAGAAAGVADARRQQQLDAQTAAEHELRRQALQAELSGRESAERRATAAEQRAARDQQLQEAGIALQQLESAGQGATVNPETASLLRGTPYGARLEDKSTLPSRSIPFAGGANLSDPGGQGYSTITPTQAQQESSSRRALLASLTDEQSGLSPSMRQFLRVREAGIGIPNPESLESQSDKDARAAKEREIDFTDFERRERLQASLRVAPAGRMVGTLVTPQQRLQARRWAQQDAADRYDALKDVNGFVPEGTSIEDLAAQLEAEYLAELGVDTSRPANPAKALGNIQQVFPGGRAVGSRQTPMVGTLVAPSQGGQSITRAELKATAQRLGMTEQQAAAEAQKRGLVVR